MTDTATVLVPSESKAVRLNAATGAIPSVDFAYINPFKLIAVRVARTYLQSLLAMITINGTGLTGVPFADFTELLWKSASMAAAPAVVSLIQNVLEILASLDQTKPELRG